jgi:hypothetical protein
MKDSYAEAIGSAQNLLVGGLSRTFAPEASVVLGISLNETCNFAQAIEAVKLFRRSYEKSYRWLYTWNQRQKQAPIDLYPMVAAYLRKKVRIPEKIANEWLRSPVFIANQEELNLLFDERQTAKVLVQRVSRKFSGKGAQKWQRAAAELRGVVNHFLMESQVAETTLVRAINNDLQLRTMRMFRTLIDLAQSVELLEAEIYNALGEKVIADAGQAQGGRKPATAGAKKKADDDAVWRWGAFPTGEEESAEAEVWEDELGFLKADVENECHSSSK